MSDMRRWIQAVNPGLKPEIRLSEYLIVASYRKLLTEAGRIEFLMKTYGQKLADKLTADQAHLPANVVAAIQREPGQQPAQKMLSYILSFDPTRKHEYASWLCVRVLKDEVKLEDLPRAHDYLQVFDNAKRIRSTQVAHRIVDTNIMNYRDLPSVLKVIQPFMTNVERAPQGDMERLTRRMSQEDQATVHDLPDMTVVIPHTEDAAKFWGLGTAWCTAWQPPRQNQFEAYNRFGPLYIAILKPSGEKYQFSFGYTAGKYRGQFMDKHDSPIDMPKFLQQHPAMVKIVGEQALLPWAMKIGLEHFSPNIRAMLSAQQLGEQIAQQDRLSTDQLQAAVPADVMASYPFQQALLSRRPNALPLIPEQMYTPHLAQLLRDCDGLWSNVPDQLKTPELAEAAVSRIDNYHVIDQFFAPEYRNPAVWAKYWRLRVENDWSGRLRLASVPEEYRTPEIIVRLLARMPEDIEQFEAQITPRMAREIVKLGKLKAGSHLPQKFFDNEHMAKTIAETGGEAWGLFRRIPEQYWDEKMAEIAAKSFAANFKDIPERFHTAVITRQFLNRRPKQVNEIPPALLEEVLTTTDRLQRGYQSSPTAFPYAVAHELLLAAKPGLIDPKVVINLLSQYPNYEIEKIGPALYRPDYLTPEVSSFLIERGCLPIKLMPPDMIDEKAILGRIAPASVAEIKDIPPEKFTEPVAVSLARQYPFEINNFPENALTTGVLNQFLYQLNHILELRSRRARNDRTAPKAALVAKELQLAQAGLHRFPAAAWTSKNLLTAINAHVYTPTLDVLPDRLIDGPIIAELARRAPDQLAALPVNRKNAQNAARAVIGEWNVAAHVNPRLMTEEFCYHALSKWAASYHGYQPKLRAALDRLPRKAWSQRCWTAAVSYVVPYAKVPDKFRSEQLKKDAVLRDPKVIKEIDQPLDLLNTNFKMKDAKAAWLKSMERLGYVVKDRKWINTESDLDREPVAGFPDYSVSVVPAGANRRVFVYHDDKPVFVLTTKDGKIRLEDASAQQKHRDVIIAIVKKYLSDYAMGDLDNLKIYKIKGKIGGGEADVERKKYHERDALEWSDVPTAKGHIFTGYLEDQPIVRVATEPKGGSGWGSYAMHDGSKILDVQRALPHAEEIASFLRQYGRVEYWWDLQNIGVLHISRGWGRGMNEVVAKRKIADNGHLSVWTNGNRVALFGPDGYLASGVLTKLGKVRNVNVNHRMEKLEPKFTAILAKAALLIMKKDNQKLDLPDVDLSPSKEREAAD